MRAIIRYCFALWLVLGLCRLQVGAVELTFTEEINTTVAYAPPVGVNGAFFSTGSGANGLTQFNGLSVTRRGSPGSPAGVRGINGQLQLEYEVNRAGSDCIMVDPHDPTQALVRVPTGSGSWGEHAGIQFSLYYNNYRRPDDLGIWCHPKAAPLYIMNPYRSIEADLGAAGPFTYLEMISSTAGGGKTIGPMRVGALGNMQLVTPPGIRRPDASRLGVLGDNLIFCHRSSGTTEICITEIDPSGSRVLRGYPELLRGRAPSIQIGTPPVAWFIATALTSEVDQLWRSDGTPEGTQIRYSGPLEVKANTLFQVDNLACFSILEAEGLMMYAFNDSERHVIDLSALGGFNKTNTLHETPGRAWLEAVRADGTRALLETGGTIITTRIVTELPGPSRGVVGHTLYGTYNTPETGEEVWGLALDGEPEVVRFDTGPDVFSGAVAETTFQKQKWGSAGGWAYFHLDDNEHGREWWASYGGAALAQVLIHSTDSAKMEARFTVRFSEPVLNVDILDFEGVRSDYLDVSLTEFLAISPTEYRVTVEVDRGDGTVGIRLREPNDITDAQGFPLGPVTDIGVDGINGSAVALGPSRIAHSIDTNLDFRVDVSELLRCIQVYNADRFYCGYTADGVSLVNPYDYWDCLDYNLDYAPADYKLSLSELLLAVQLYNARNGYEPCEGSEDGYCPQP